MANDKNKEAEYKAEGLRRAYIRLNERAVKWRKRGERGGGSLHNGKECSYCGGQMRWCQGCQMWSRVCCEDYGTCQCS
jgi:hypothetical protein